MKWGATKGKELRREERQEGGRRMGNREWVRKAEERTSINRLLPFCNLLLLSVRPVPRSAS